MAGKDTAPKGEEFRDGMPFVGGRLWIDLLNTTPLDAAQRTIDLIGTPDGLAAWIAAAGLEFSATAESEDALRALRRTLRSEFEVLRAGEPVSDATIAQINALLRHVHVSLCLTRSQGGVKVVEVIAADPAGYVAEDFSRFVCDFEPARLKHCSSPTCSMVFYDAGKNNTRRWCTMSVCGNRDKVARFRSRKAAKG
ncbi:CGNR zinc finger domain-containing protein [Bosea psychrotolerans]|nr:CGNR zinc finger domain-containing protein [Bosea psychrotolerans]